RRRERRECRSAACRAPASRAEVAAPPRGLEGSLAKRPSGAFKSSVDSLRREKHPPRFDEYGMTRFSIQRVVLRSWEPRSQACQHLIGDTERAAPLLEPPAGNRGDRPIVQQLDIV